MLSDPVWKEMKSQENRWAEGKGAGIGAALMTKHVVLEPDILVCPHSSFRALAISPSALSCKGYHHHYKVILEVTMHRLDSCVVWY